MTRQKVSDPALLAQLGESPRQKVTDPALLSQLNGDDEQEDAGAYLDNLPKPEGFLSKLPRNIGAGLAGMGHETMNLPHDVAQGLENKAQSFGQSINDAFPLPKSIQDKLAKQNQGNFSDYIPHQQEYDFAQMLGQQGEGTLMDNLIQKGIKHAPEIVGGSALLRGGVRRLKGTHQLDEVRNRATRGDLFNFGYTPETIAEARNYLPPSHATNEMIRGAQTGNYNPAFSLQSQIGHHQRNLARSPLASERLLSPRVGELKQNMLNQLEGALRSQGLTEEADLLRGGINNYRQYTRVKEAAMPVIKYLGIPTTILTALGFGFKKGKKVLAD